MLYCLGRQFERGSRGGDGGCMVYLAVAYINFTFAWQPHKNALCLMATGFVPHSSGPPKPVATNHGVALSFHQQGKICQRNARRGTRVPKARSTVQRGVINYLNIYREASVADAAASSATRNSHSVLRCCCCTH